jgi:peptide/nickel transport system permease protein
VKAALGFGAGSLHVMRRHIVPDIGLVLVASLVAAAGRAILLEAGLAFLGLGDPSRTSWGSIMRDARQSQSIFYTDIWTWWMLPPIVAIVLLLLGMTFLGVGLEQRINPRLSRHGAGVRGS